MASHRRCPRNLRVSQLLTTISTHRPSHSLRLRIRRRCRGRRPHRCPRVRLPGRPGWEAQSGSSTRPGSAVSVMSSAGIRSPADRSRTERCGRPRRQHRRGHHHRPTARHRTRPQTRAPRQVWSADAFVPHRRRCFPESCVLTAAAMASPFERRRAACALARGIPCSRGQERTWEEPCTSMLRGALTISRSCTRSAIVNRLLLTVWCESARAQATRSWAVVARAVE